MHYETGVGLKPEFIDGVRNFIEHTMTLDIFKNNGLVRVMVHLYRNGFKPRYFVWIDHGESDGLDGGMEPEQYFDEAPNEEARHFYDQLEESSRHYVKGVRILPC
ncbi:hypothetical protein H5410_057494 [Solanum commersonii]|uniref:Uncharacterized protein n=1 Tax=Solanum commersonii TaxID=4109 RepID=A0A9J5WQS4_SOLCO|nr:hypothetical protein H5410_057494 [Solanum commersonii]